MEHLRRPAIQGRLAYAYEFAFMNWTPELGQDRILHLGKRSRDGKPRLIKQGAECYASPNRFSTQSGPSADDKLGGLLGFVVWLAEPTSGSSFGLFLE